MVLGITGGVGCGKSTVLDIMHKQYGARIILADALGRILIRRSWHCLVTGFWILNSTLTGIR